MEIVSHIIKPLKRKTDLSLMRALQSLKFLKIENLC